MIRIESLLRKEIGLDVASVGSSLIERAARLRMKALGLKTVADYRERLERSREERAELIEAVVVNETWFFRDPDSFKAFTSVVRQQWLPGNHVTPLRILSVPCSSGEEPYSLAIALLDAGLLPERFAIDAVDVSSRVLARARRAVFGRNSFRGTDLTFRDRYFREGRDGYALDPRVCGCVQFVQDNLLAENFLRGRTSYDFVFCRNLLIYFDPPTQIRAIATLKSVLAPRGILFVGPAELQIFLDHGFKSLDLPMAFACRKDVPAEKAPARAPVIAPARPNRPAPIPSPAAVKPVGKGPDGPDLTVAQKLADAGQLKAAAEICEAWLREKGPSAQAYYLLGLVHDAADDAQAGDFYRKALYLDPEHYESLWQMALLSEKHGDATSARTFKRRAERAHKKVPTKS